MCLRTARYPAVLHIFLSPINPEVKVIMRTIQFQYEYFKFIKYHQNIIVMHISIFTKQQHNTTQHNTTQLNSTQHNTTQHNTTHTHESKRVRSDTSNC